MRLDVTRLREPCQDARGRELLKGNFVSGVREGLKRSWSEAGFVQEKCEFVDTLNSFFSSNPKNAQAQPALASCIVANRPISSGQSQYLTPCPDGVPIFTFTWGVLLLSGGVWHPRACYCT